MRKPITVTPEASAASASLRLAVRSSRRGSRHSSTTATPTPGQRTTSAAARSTANGSGMMPRMTCAGCRPISASPGACSRPPCFSAWPSRSQTRVPPSRNASTATKPVAQPASWASAANTSCTRPRASPPPSAASISACPVRTHPAACACAPAACTRSMRAIRLLRDSRESRNGDICSYYVPFRGTSNASRANDATPCAPYELLTLRVNSLLN